MPQELGAEFSEFVEFFESRRNRLNLIWKYLPLIDQTLDNLISLCRYSQALMLLAELEAMFSPTHDTSQAPDTLLDGLANMLNKLGFRYSKVAKASGLLEAHERAVGAIETAFSVFHTPYVIECLPRVHRDIAKYLTSQGQLGPAIKHLQRAVEVDPQFGDGWWHLSMVYVQLQDGKTAMSCLQRAAALGDEDALAMMATLAGR